MSRLLSQVCVTYRGHTFVLKSKGIPPDLRLLTFDASVAAQVGFEPHPSGGFIGHVPFNQVAEVFTDTWWGMLHGEKVLIRSESGDHYDIESESPENAQRYGFRRLDKLTWGGLVPKADLTKVWSTREPFHLGW